MARATVEALRVGAGSDEAARNLLLWSKKVQPPTLPKRGDGAGEVASSSFGVAARSSMVLRFLSLDGARTMQRCLPFKQWTSDQKKRLGGLTSEFTAELAEASLAQFVRSSALSPPLHQFATVDEVNDALLRLTQRDDGPFVVRLNRQPGRRDAQYAHLFGIDDPAAATDEAPPPPSTASGRKHVSDLEARVAALEQSVAQLKQDLGIEDQSD